MAEIVFTCPVHDKPLIPFPLGGALPGLACPEANCDISVRVSVPHPGVPGLPQGLTPFEQGCAAHHELIRSYEGAGFSRSEAMDVLKTLIYAGVMKGSGSG